MPASKYIAIVLFALANVLNSVFLFMQPAWFNPFVGILASCVVPFATAMAVLFRSELCSRTTVAGHPRS